MIMYNINGRDGDIEAEVVNRAVPTNLLKDSCVWKYDGCSMEDLYRTLPLKHPCRISAHPPFLPKVL